MIIINNNCHRLDCGGLVAYAEWQKMGALAFECVVLVFDFDRVL